MIVESEFPCQTRFNFRDHRAIVTGGSRGIGRAPGMVMTDMARALPEATLHTAFSELVLSDFPEPEDISNAVLFLLSDAARYITGEILRVDSGQYI